MDASRHLSTPAVCFAIALVTLSVVSVLIDTMMLGDFEVLLDDLNPWIGVRQYQFPLSQETAWDEVAPAFGRGVNLLMFVGVLWGRLRK